MRRATGEARRRRRAIEKGRLWSKADARVVAMSRAEIA